MAPEERPLVACEPRYVDPPEEIAPDVGVSRQPSTFMHVDFPHPLGPMTATKITFVDTEVYPLRACSSACPLPYTFVIP
jgi:hypothetical protein